jgi:SPP1 gp7 family putative phage head morphogenesis protein
MADTQDLTGELLRRAVDLRRYENGLAARVRAVLEDVRDEIVARLSRLDPTVMGGGYQARRLRALLAQVTETLRTGYRDASTLASRELRDVAEMQAETLLRSLRYATGLNDLSTVAVGATRLRAIIDTRPLQGFVMRDWFSRQARNVGEHIEAELRIGLVQSESIGDLVRRIRGRAVSPGNYVGGVMTTSTRQAEAIVRTAVNEVANAAQTMTLEANRDIVGEYQWLATLDERTCPVCGGLDGKTWRLDDPKGRKPPAHWLCRCTTVAVIDWKGIGLTPPAPGTRASTDGPVSAGLDFETWLRGRSAESQNEMLGRARAELFRAGKVSLQDLTATDNRVLSLNELKARMS